MLTEERARPSPVARTGSVARAVGLLALVGIALLVLLVSIGIGSRDIGLAQSWSLLWGGTAGDTSGTEAAIVRDLRVPRGLLALAVGAALGVSGAMMQGLSRNPLADPGLLGVNAGASALVVVAIGVFGVGTITGYVWFGLVGAALAMLVVHVLGATGRSSGTPERLVLAGSAVTAVLIALVNAALVLTPSTFDAFRFWNLGSLSGRRLDVLLAVAPFLAIGIVAAVAMARALDTLALGDRAGQALGLDVERTRALAGAVVTVLAGAATAAVGPIAFLGLAVPHVVRGVVGPTHRWLLPYTAVLGAIVLLVADVVGRVVAPPGEIQVGVTTAVLGVPVFVALCRRRRLVGV
ncbi:FecCD family ABC transporter permease [Actinomycetospora straminea]|uniref:Iron chelate uptake ABC transporter family permease subunit n=1 Tax=Actinomycetospora straminea TaxID=663607 RepID=A0ABP9F5Y5_9PSEU|nr:iron ABC transporter permease [Actinomycetospora straminea]MDD7933666.1 iron ABC transporter permease [Actinomycetospora straminea]